MKQFFYLTIIVFVLFFLCTTSINVALHAQVNPNNKQIVGSVITTDGLKSALQSRFDVHNVSVFYPSTYSGFLDTEWDFIVIEGWFRSINEFIQLSRNRFRDVKIVYICLDGHYPPFDSLVNFDLDGILTNSIVLFGRLDMFVHKSLMLLAADTDVMRPMQSPRDNGAVFVGAGGPMLALKPGLYEMLVDSLSLGLRLHGFHWEDVPLLGDVSRGPLPRFDIAEAYSSAQVVITSAIDEQDRLGMVNNRIFEALSCEAVVVSQRSSTLERMLTNRTRLPDGSQPLDLVLFVDEANSIQQVIERVVREKAHFDEVRRQGRQFVLARHSWRHRAVQLMQFYRQIVSGASSVSNDSQKPPVSAFCLPFAHSCARVNCPRLLWVTSESLLRHQDYLALTGPTESEGGGLRVALCAQYAIDAMSEEEFSLATRPPADATQCTSPPLPPPLSSYDVLLVISTPFDPLDLLASDFVARFPSILVDGKDRMQRRLLYVLGVDLRGMSRHCQSQVDALRRLGASEASATEAVSKEVRLRLGRTYDVLLYRSPFEVSLLRRAGVELLDLRLQHAFGVGQHNPAVMMGFDRIDSVFVCFAAFHSLCTASRRQRAAEQHGVDDRLGVLLLVGDTWGDWLALEGVVRLEDVDRVVHVSDGQWSGEAVSLVQRAGRVFLMHEGDGDGGAKGDQIGAVVSGCVKEEGGSPAWCSTETVSTKLWPLVAAAVSADASDGLRGRIHLAVSNAHLLSSVTTDGASGWSYASLSREVRYALDRLHGFGSTRSSLTVEPLQLREEGGRVLCDNCPGDLLQSNYLAHSAFVSSADGMSAQWALLRLDYGVSSSSSSSFAVGRDGEACVQLREGGEDRVCLLRPFRYVKLVVHRGLVASRLSSVNLTFSLRGTFFADTFYSQHQTIDLSSGQPPLNGSAAVLHDANILDDIYVYNVYL